MEAEDRRIFERIKLKFPLRFLASMGGIEGQAEAVDISGNGLGFISNANLPEKTTLEMWLEIPDHHAPFYTRGEVIWSKALDNTGQQRVGVRILRENFIGFARIFWADKSA
jgi:hypothetical protein